MEHNVANVGDILVVNNGLINFRIVSNVKKENKTEIHIIGLFLLKKTIFFSIFHFYSYAFVVYTNP